LTPVFISTGFW